MVGTWTLTDDGEFILNEPYATMLQEARIAATNGWANALFDYLTQRCPYTTDELKAALLEKNDSIESPDEMMNEFVLQALGGEL